MEIFPNPNEGQFTISIESSRKELNPFIINILNIEGKTIFEKKINENADGIHEKIELDNATKGMYLIRISNGIRSTSKLISIH